MDPITMMRNALGKEEGGSGVPLDREKYMESVKFWSEHATIDPEDQPKEKMAQKMVQREA